MHKSVRSAKLTFGLVILTVPLLTRVTPAGGGNPLDPEASPKNPSPPEFEIEGDHPGQVRRLREIILEGEEIEGGNFGR